MVMMMMAHLHVLDQFAGEGSSKPLHGGRPDGLASDAEEGDQKVCKREVDDECVDSRLSSPQSVHLHQRRCVADEGDDEHDAEDNGFGQAHLRP